MKTVTEVECKNWCKALHNPIIVSNSGQLVYETAGAHAFAVAVPGPFLQRVGLCYSLLSFPSEDYFQGGMLWLREWNIGAGGIERVGWKVMEQMRRGYGQSASLENEPGHAFRSDEFVDAQAFVLQAMAFEWDAFLIPSISDYYIFISHSGTVHCIANEASKLEELCSRLNRWGPRNELPFFLQRK